MTGSGGMLYKFHANYVEAQITSDAVAGVDKNVYVEPLIWTVGWTQGHYSYQQTRSN